MFWDGIGRRVAALTITGALAGLSAGASSGLQDHSAHEKDVGDTQRYTKRWVEYRAPEVLLQDQNGNDLALAEILNSGEPIALNFIFTTCTTICPVMTATFAHMALSLGPDGNELRMLSISIDPDFDSPTVLKQYAQRFGAGPEWSFLTGDPKRITTVLKAFESYTGSKGSHRPVTLLKGPESQRWLRIDGLASGADLSAEYLQLLGEP